MHFGDKRFHVENKFLSFFNPVIIGSTVSVDPLAGMSDGAAKAGLSSMVRGLILDLKGTGIRVNILSPGTIDTESLRGAFAKASGEDKVETINTIIMDNIKGKVVIITGGSSGIGKATANLLADRGAKVVIAARGKEKLEKVSQDIADAGGEISQLVTDVGQYKDILALVLFAMEKYGKIDVFVSNAGIALNSPLDEIQVEEWETMIDINFKSVLYAIAATLPIFRKQEFGHFINVVSTAGLRIVPTQVVYAATKNAVRTISEGLRQEAGEKLRVTVVSPGFVNTNLVNTIKDEAVRAETTKKRDEIAIPPEAIARAIAFAIDQPENVDVGDIVVRPTAQA